MIAYNVFTNGSWHTLRHDEHEDLRYEIFYTGLASHKIAQGESMSECVAEYIACAERYDRLNDAFCKDNPDTVFDSSEAEIEAYNRWLEHELTMNPVELFERIKDGEYHTFIDWEDIDDTNAKEVE